MRACIAAVLWVWVCCGFIHAADKPVVDRLESRKAIYRKKSLQIESEYLADLQKNMAKYVKAVKTSAEKAQDAGKLELTIALRQEVADLKSGDAAPDIEDVDDHPVLARIKSGYRGAIAKNAVAKRDKQISLVQSYIGALEKAVAGYVRDDKIAKAQEVQEEIERQKGVLSVYGMEEIVATPVRSRNGRKGNVARGGLVLYFSFDQVVNGKVTDRSGRKNHGVLVGAKRVVPGKRGAACSFDGVSAFVRVLGSRWLNMTDGITVAMWVYPKSVGTGNGGTMLDKGNNQQYRIKINGGGNSPWFLVGQSKGNLAINMRTGNDTLPIGKWTHVVCTANPGRDCRIYVDGKLSESKAMKDKMNVVNSSMLLGATSGSPKREFFDGMLDEVMIYDRPLTDRQVFALYNAIAK